jgi:hypothetical protein
MAGRASEELTASTETGTALEESVGTAIFKEATPDVDFEDADGLRVEQVVSRSEVGRETEAASAREDEVALAFSEIIEVSEVGRSKTETEVMFIGIEVVLAVEVLFTEIEVELATTGIDVELATSEVNVVLAATEIGVELATTEVEVVLAETGIVVATVALAEFVDTAEAELVELL